MCKYSIALMLALLGGGVTPAWAGHGCWGGRVLSYGCYGGGYGCQGGWYSSGWVPAGAGCWGGSGSGWVSVRYGCHGGGGCFGGTAVGYGCYGGWSTGWVPVSNGCRGGAYASEWTPVSPPSSPAAPVSTKAERETLPAPATTQVEPQVPRPAARPPDVPPNQAEKQGPGAPNSGSAVKIGLPEEMGGKAPATIEVRVPAGARLKVNNVLTGQSSGPRKLVSPPLERGKDFHYTLKAEIARDGRTFTASKRIAVRAGEVKRVTLELTAQAATSGASGSVSANETRPRAGPQRPTAARPSPSAD